MFRALPNEIQEISQEYAETFQSKFDEFIQEAQGFSYKRTFDKIWELS